MKLLSRLILSMEKEDLRNFRLFAERIRSDRFDKKMIDLFEAIHRGLPEDDPSLRLELYPEGNRNAFYRLKNRLQAEVQRSLLLLHHELDPRSKVLKLLMLSRWCQYRGEWEGARMLLEQAGKICETERIPRYHVLIYEELLELSREDINIDPAPYVQRLRELDQEYKGFREFNQTLALVTHNLKRTNLTAPDESMLSQLAQIKTQLDTFPRSDHPDQQWQFHQVVREILLEKKEYTSLESFLLSSYEDLQESGAFTKSYLREKIVLISWIINTLTQNRKFEASLIWAAQLKEALEEQHRRYEQTFVWTYYQALIINYTYLGRLEEAEEQLIHLTGSSREYLPPQHLPYVLMNRFRISHYRGNAQGALSTLSELFSGDLVRQMEEETRLSGRIAEIITRLELSDWEFANYQYKETRRKFRSFLDSEAGTDHLSMLTLLRPWIRSGVRTPGEKIRQAAAILLQPGNLSLSAGAFINYHAWLSARLAGTSYFEIVRSRMLGEDPE